MGQSRNEDALENILGAQNELLPPMSRNEKILHAILGEEIELDEPQSRIEELLTEIYEEGLGKPEQAKTVQLQMESGNQTILPDEDYVLSQVTVEKPSTLISSNIKKDINIGGVVGTLALNPELVHQSGVYSVGDTISENDFNQIKNGFKEDYLVIAVCVYRNYTLRASIYNLSATDINAGMSDNNGFGYKYIYISYDSDTKKINRVHLTLRDILGRNLISDNTDNVLFQVYKFN